MKRVFRKAKKTAAGVKAKGEEYVEAKRLENEPPKKVPTITSTEIPEQLETVRFA